MGSFKREGHPSAPKKKEKKEKPKRIESIGTSTLLKGFTFSWIAGQLAEIMTLSIDVCNVCLQLEGEHGAARRYKHIGDANILWIIQDGSDEPIKNLLVVIVQCGKSY